MASRSTALAGPVDLAFRPASQTVVVGDPVEIGVYATSADGADQSVGFVGAVFIWDPGALSLVGHNDAGAFAWAGSGFPSDAAGVNNTFLDGDAYYQAVVLQGGPLATATAAGSLVTTLQFTALSATVQVTSVVIIGCVGSTCSQVLDGHPFDTGVSDVTGSLAAPVVVTVLCALNAQCDDGNPCSDDVCGADQVCAFTPDDTNDPNDGQFCNGQEVCQAGQVVIVTGSVPNCDDAVSCTVDGCNEATDACQHTVEAGFCLIDVECHADGTLNPLNDCEACDAALDAQAWSLRSAGASCGDRRDFDCDRPDSCNGSGVCLDNLEPAGASCGDASVSDCSAPDTCDGAGRCDANHAVDGAQCDDGLFCTVSDACQTGVCSGTGDACVGLTCDEVTDRCKRVDLELRPSKQGPVAVGGLVGIEVFAVRGTATDQPISGLNVILQWPVGAMELLGNIDNGPYDWLLSGFPNDSGLDGLNKTFLDGNALYQATSQPSPAIVSAGGLLVTTLQFRVLDVGTPAVGVVAAFGEFTQTNVLDAETDGLNITGSLGVPAAVNVVECLVDEDCNDGEFCTGVETCVDFVCVPGTPPDCDDGVFCTGTESCEFGVGCVSPGNPCPDPFSCDDALDNCGGCDAPMVTAEGCRYFAVTPPPGIDPVAILVVIDPGPAAESMYVQADGNLGPLPVFFAPSDWGTVHVTGGNVRPDMPIGVHADCRFDGSGSVSSQATLTTWLWGDANGDGAVLIDDVGLVFGGSQGSFPDGVSVPNLDLGPCIPNRAVDAEDVQHVQDAFGGNPFPFPNPCQLCPKADAPQPTAGVGPRNRYIVVHPGNAGRLAAIRLSVVGLPQPFQNWNGIHLFASAPRQICENSGQGLGVSPPDCGPAPGLAQRWFWAARLVCNEAEAALMDWSVLADYCVGGANDGGVCADDINCPGGVCGADAAVHLYGNGVVPSRLASSTGPIQMPAKYLVQMVDASCTLTDENSYSSGLSVTQSGWGDVVTDCAGCPCGPPDASIGVVTDVVSLINKFSNLVCAPTKTRADIEPGSIDFQVTFFDVVQTLGAFAGGGFPFSSGACTDGVCSGGPLQGALCGGDADCVPDLCP